MDRVCSELLQLILYELDGMSKPQTYNGLTRRLNLCPPLPQIHPVFPRLARLYTLSQMTRTLAHIIS